jgi:hypothetical protein
MSAKNSADSSEKDEDFGSENAPGATPGRTPLDFRLVNGMPAPPGQMVRDLAGWQAQQQDQEMTDEGSGTGTEPLNPGKMQPDDVWNQREQVWQQYIQKHPDVAQAEESQVKTTIVEREESAGTEREESAGTPLPTWARYYPRNTVIPWVIPKICCLCPQGITFYWLI